LSSEFDGDSEEMILTNFTLYHSHAPIILQNPELESSRISIDVDININNNTDFILLGKPNSIFLSF